MADKITLAILEAAVSNGKEAEGRGVCHKGACQEMGAARSRPRLRGARFSLTVAKHPRKQLG